MLLVACYILLCSIVFRKIVATPNYRIKIGVVLVILIMKGGVRVIKIILGGVPDIYRKINKHVYFPHLFEGKPI